MSKLDHFLRFIDSINDKAGKEFAEILDILYKAKVLIPDDDLEAFSRLKYKLPPKSEEGQRSHQPTPPVPSNPSDDNEDDDQELSHIPGHSIKFAESEQKKMKRESENLAKIMKEHLGKMSIGLADNAAKNFDKASDLGKIKSVLKVQAKGVGAYKKELKEFFTKYVENQEADYRKTASKYVDSEKFSFMFANIKKKSKNFVDLMSDTMAETGAADLEKSTYFQFGSSIDSTQDPNIMKQDILEANERKINQSVNASLTPVSQVNAKSFHNFFFDKEMKDEIESFTYVNPDPKTDICDYLSGMTFSVDDAEALRYTPPLHYNCMTTLSPNFRAASGNPEPTTIAPSAKQQDQINLCGV